MVEYIKTQRIDANRVQIISESGLDMVLFANEDVSIDRASIQEISTIAEIKSTIKKLVNDGFFGDYPAEIIRAIFTPDFHKGAGIPIGTVLESDGFVLPKTAGDDIGCGMRLLTTNMSKNEFKNCNNLDNILRHAFFQGGRNIPLDEKSREGMLREGVIGIKPPNQGIWQKLDMNQAINELDKTHNCGSWPTDNIWMFNDYVKGSGGISRDSAIGSIGGGNHFCEIQYVDECLDKKACYEWGIKESMITIMVHTGSVGLGGMVGGHFVDLAKKIHPTHLKMPNQDYYPLPTTGPLSSKGYEYLSAMGLAANFATVNRLTIGAVVLECLSESTGKTINGRLVYDSPHNLVWTKEQRHLHRKGATPAELNCEDHIFSDGHPVIVPGSMGDASYVLKGNGNIASLCSAPHGAGRIAARGAGRKGDVNEMNAIRVITKIDLKTVRRDIADEYRKDLMEEAPSQYKSILPVIETTANAGIATPVARLQPLLTIKG